MWRGLEHFWARQDGANPVDVGGNYLYTCRRWIVVPRGREEFIAGEVAIGVQGQDGENALLTGRTELEVQRRINIG
ncbi:hypothetical protein OHA18_25730 [Kribbella sp. NBC_00709]|nr:hypothetical protein [Kribbella sp. NBC_00709]